jgi:hypothetical protein
MSEKNENKKPPKIEFFNKLLESGKHLWLKIKGRETRMPFEGGEKAQGDQDRHGRGPETQGWV